VFAPGIVSLGFHELSLTVSADGSDIVYVISDGNYHYYSLVHVELTPDGWRRPELLPFHGPHRDYACQFDPAKDVLYFSSNRPLPHSADSSTGHHLWRTELAAEGWGEPTPLDLPGNLEHDQSCASVALSGNIYFLRKSDEGIRNIYVYRYADGVYPEAEPLGPPLSFEEGVGRPYVAPDESYLMFQAVFDEGFGSGDLYVSYRNDTTWSEPVNLGETINTEDSDFGPIVSPDGKYLFFSSYRGLPKEECLAGSYQELMEAYRTPENGYATLYWVDASIIEQLKPQELK
jgi:hypothetical protein